MSYSTADAFPELYGSGTTGYDEGCCQDCAWESKPAIGGLRFIGGWAWYGVCMACVRKYAQKNPFSGIEVRRFGRNLVWVFQVSVK